MPRRCACMFMWSITILASLLWSSVGPAHGQETKTEQDSFELPVDQIPAQLRDSVRLVLEQPKLASRGTAEVFPCQPEHYHWLLDHPDQAAKVWLKLGAKNLTIADRGNGHFAWTDNIGSEVRWEMIYDTPKMRIWYAEGSVRPAVLLPLLPAKAVLVLRFSRGTDELGRNMMRHQADLYLHSDDKTSAIVIKLFGNSVTKSVEQFVGQVELFFSAMAWYMNKHPEMAQALMTDKALSAPLEPATLMQPTLPPSAAERSPNRLEK